MVGVLMNEFYSCIVCQTDTLPGADYTPPGVFHFGGRIISLMKTET